MSSIQASSLWSELPYRVSKKLNIQAFLLVGFLAYFCYIVAFVRRLYICEYVIIDDKEVDFWDGTFLQTSICVQIFQGTYLISNVTFTLR